MYPPNTATNTAPVQVGQADKTLAGLLNPCSRSSDARRDSPYRLHDPHATLARSNDPAIRRSPESPSTSSRRQSRLFKANSSGPTPRDAGKNPSGSQGLHGRLRTTPPPPPPRPRPGKLIYRRTPAFSSGRRPQTHRRSKARGPPAGLGPGRLPPPPRAPRPPSSLRPQSPSTTSAKGAAPGSSRPSAPHVSSERLCAARPRRPRPGAPPSSRSRRSTASCGAAHSRA